MVCTPQTTVTLSEMAEAIKSYQSFALCGHINPDGDCVGSQLALYWALRELGKDVVALKALDEPLNFALSTLPGASELQAAIHFSGKVDAFIACDVPTRERLGDAARIHDEAEVTFTLDHHAVPTSMARYNYVDPDAPATSFLAWQLIKELGVTPTSRMAQCAYAGLMTDTGGFRYQNTTAETLRCAAEMIEAGAQPALSATNFFQNQSFASVELMQRMLQHTEFDFEKGYAIGVVSLKDFVDCNAQKADAEGLIDTLRSIAGIRVACVLREAEAGVRGSLRAKDENDVSIIARKFDGGGHKAAAGFTHGGSLEQAQEDLRCSIVELLSHQGALS